MAEQVNVKFLSLPSHIKPRLKHIEPGQSFRLLHWDVDKKKYVPDKKRHILIRKCKQYAYYPDGNGGEIRNTLSHEISYEGMIFGDGKGWRKL